MRVPHLAMGLISAPKGSRKKIERSAEALRDATARILSLQDNTTMKTRGQLWTQSRGEWLYRYQVFGIRCQALP